MIKFGVVVFPGSNCDYDAYYSTKKILGFDAEFIWHKNENINNSDVIILPGGFTYGDYLRAGAIAKFSPIMDAVINFAERGGIVLGICNGFQILLETGLLPGAMLENESLKFICKDVYVKINSRENIFTNKIEKDVLKIPIAHAEGNYFATEDVLEELEKNSQIVFQYSSPEGEISEDFNPNGSLKNIAGITNKRKNVLGMMPHPERACDLILKRTDGALIFKSIVENLIS
jgi:phosphoribosylformylglycinamidine synthase I